MRVPNLENLIQEAEQRLSKPVYGLHSDYYGHRSKVVRIIMVYERAQHLLASRSHQLMISHQTAYLTYGEVTYISKQASRLGGGSYPIHKYITEQYGAPSIENGDPVYGIVGLNIAIDKIKDSLQAYLVELDAQNVE